MNTHPGYTDDELKEEIANQERALRALRTASSEVRVDLHNLKTALKDRLDHEPVDVPRWVLEVLSAHARKRYENIQADNRTPRYAKALIFVEKLIGEMWPRDIDGEHHGCIPKGGRR